MKRVPALTFSVARRQHHAVFGERRPLEVSVFGDDRLMENQRPQPGNVDAVRGQVVHEALLEFVVVDGRGEVAVQDLETVVGSHVERVLDVLDGDIALGHAVDGIPPLLRQELLRRVQRVLAEDALA